MSEEHNHGGHAPGWEAIDAALYPLYGDREPLHVGTKVPYALGGPDPIHGISVYKNSRPLPHWHFVTYGFSELWEKNSTDPEVSGFGFELTYRCVCNAKDRKPANWSAFNFLQNLGRYVFETGNPLGAGHTMPLNGPIDQGAKTLIHAISFCRDPKLPPIDTPNGNVQFLQVVGLTMDELEAISSWNASAFLELRRHDDPFLLTDLRRKSWLLDHKFAAKVAERTQAEGSSCGWLALVLECDTESKPAVVRVQTIAVDGMKRRLLGRLPFGRELTLNDSAATVIFKPGKQAHFKVHEGAVIMTLRDDQVVELVNSMVPHAGIFPVPGLKEVVIEVVPTAITDRDGKVVDVVE